MAYRGSSDFAFYSNRRAQRKQGYQENAIAYYQRLAREGKPELRQREEHEHETLNIGDSDHYYAVVLPCGVDGCKYNEGEGGENINI